VVGPDIATRYSLLASLYASLGYLPGLVALCTCVTLYRNKLPVVITGMTQPLSGLFLRPGCQHERGDQSADDCDASAD